MSAVREVHLKLRTDDREALKGHDVHVVGKARVPVAHQRAQERWPGARRGDRGARASGMPRSSFSHHQEKPPANWQYGCPACRGRFLRIVLPYLPSGRRFGSVGKDRWLRRLKRSRRKPMWPTLTAFLNRGVSSEWAMTAQTSPTMYVETSRYKAFKS